MPANLEEQIWPHLGMFFSWQGGIADRVWGCRLSGRLAKVSCRAPSLQAVPLTLLNSLLKRMRLLMDMYVHM